MTGCGADPDLVVAAGMDSSVQFFDVRKRKKVTSIKAPQAGEWRAVPGFSLEESDPIRGNFVGKTVTWRRGSSTLSALAGKRLRIHAATADAKLFSITLGCSK